MSAQFISCRSHRMFVASFAAQLCRIAAQLILSSAVALRIAPTYLIALLEVCREAVERLYQNVLGGGATVALRSP
jgi:hypothetical protein